jgi:ABC-type phosphate/phosphonate transport system substrate-binding protein
MLILGAVAYDPKVVTIWDGFQDYFAARGLPFDYILYTNYERQVEALFGGNIDVAWNSPLAWLQSERLASQLGRHVEAICMRDTDRDLTSVVIGREGGPARISELVGCRVAVGSRDSPQATILPLHFLAQQGLEPHRDFEVVEFDLLRGKHGCHIGGEREACRALARGDCDAACIIDRNHLLFVHEGTLPAGATRVIAQTPPYDHYNLTALTGTRPEVVEQFRQLLLGMAYPDPAVRRLLDLKGLKRWLPGRREGYAQLARAMDGSGWMREFVAAVASRCS